MRRLLVVAAALLGLCAPADAADRTVTDDAGRRIVVPDHPVRVVSLDDMSLTVPLLELGVIPIGSQGRLDKAGRPFVRSSRALTGLDFDNTGMAFLGMNPVDVEAVAALKPDLIVTLQVRSTPIGQLQQIAPTVVIDDLKRDSAAIYALLAHITGRQAEAAKLEQSYRDEIAELRRLMPAGGLSASVITATADGKIAVEHTYGSLGTVLRDAGFRFPPLVDALPRGGSVTLSPEALPELDADILFDTYRNDRGEQPDDARARLEAMLPDACTFLRACRDGRYFIVPRDDAKSFSYSAKSKAVRLVAGILRGDTE